MTDLISRQAAIEALDGKIEITGRTNAEAVKGYVRLVKDRLERLPSAQPEPQRTGRWINDGEAYALYKCSVCNDFCTVVGYANCIPEERMYKTMKYCPNCGAKMERS